VEEHVQSGKDAAEPGLVDDPEFKFLFMNHAGLVDPDDLARLKLWPEPERLHRALQLLSLAVTQVWEKAGPPGGVQFGFEDKETFDAHARAIGARFYDIVFSLGLFQQSIALFRKLSLANAFGKYSQVTPLDVESLGRLRAISGIRELRAREAGPSIDSLLKLEDARTVSREQLRAFIARPPVDSKHRFDIQTLLIPSLLFAYWHEVGHIIHGHVDWIGRHGGATGLSECASLERGAAPQAGAPTTKQRRDLEYWADDFAAGRVALEILRSAHKETEHYVLGPFWFNRENFNTFGLKEGLPGEKLEFNLEGFMYRIAFGLSAFLLQFNGFFRPPHQDRTEIHPHAEVRLAHIVDAILLQLNAGQQMVMTELARMWGEQYGYAIQTLELCLAANGATCTPIAQDGSQIRAMFHLQEVMARTKRSGQDARAMSALIDPHRHRVISEVLEPMNGQVLLPPSARGQMMGFDVR
jgi:hypothetical protein